MKYRPHRGSLKDSMREVVELPSIDALKEHLRLMGWPDGVVLIEKYGGFDDRIGWDTYIVTIDGEAVGFTDSELSQKPID